MSSSSILNVAGQALAAALPAALDAAVAARPRAPAGSRKSTAALLLSGAAAPGAAGAGKTGKAGRTTAGAGASKATGAGKAAAGTSKAGYATGSLPAALAFLRDPKLSTDEKLFRFMVWLTKEGNKEIQSKLEAFAARAGGSGKASGASAGGGSPRAGGSSKAGKAAKGAGGGSKGGLSIWKAFKAAVPAVGVLAQVFGDATLRKLVKEASGPVLAAAATALGAPALAPLALQLGPSLGELATSEAGLLGGAARAKGGGKGSGGAGGAAGAGSSGAGGAGGAGAKQGAGLAEGDRQVLLMELQHAQAKQQELTAMCTNVMRALHDQRMGIVHNLRS